MRMPALTKRLQPDLQSISSIPSETQNRRLPLVMATLASREKGSLTRSIFMTSLGVQNDNILRAFAESAQVRSAQALKRLTDDARASPLTGELMTHCALQSKKQSRITASASQPVSSA
jgi:hypothetical protein